jgi:hypothetical protein
MISTGCSIVSYNTSYTILNVLWLIDPFLGSDHKTNNETTFAARQQILISKNRWPLLPFGKHIPAAVDMHATLEELLEKSSMQSFLRCYNWDWLEQPVQCSVESQAVKRRLGGWCEMAAHLGASQLKVRL